MFSKHDHDHMRAALSWAARGLGRTAPNPSVGCVIVKNDRVIAMARTGDGGRPHAETIALEKAGHESKGATAYVTLEPCSHHGKTPPCADALINAGLRRVVIACKDTDPRVQGQGIERLRKAGLQVDVGLMEKEATEINAGFFMRIRENRPLVTLKIAATKDNAVALQNRRWITGDLARRYAHLERSQHDAIMIGIETALADDPHLTTRIPGINHKPVRIILDTNLRLPLTSRLAQSASEAPIWMFYQNDPENKAEALQKRGLRLFHQDPRNLKAILQTLAVEGISRLLIDGGPRLLLSFMEQDLWDRFSWYKAPAQKSDQPALKLDPALIAPFQALKPQETRLLGEDLLEIFVKPA